MITIMVARMDGLHAYRATKTQRDRNGVQRRRNGREAGGRPSGLPPGPPAKDSHGTDGRSATAFLV
jgi:hypothetical protein